MLEKALSELIGHKPRGMFERPGKIVVKPVSDDIGNGLYFQADIRQRFLGKIDVQRFDTNMFQTVINKDVSHLLHKMIV